VLSLLEKIFLNTSKKKKKTPEEMDA
jgi:hypothetical protein